MFKQTFFDVYTKFKLHFYQEIFRRCQSRDGSLTTVETFCMETIQTLGTPTVNEFAEFMHISSPNATYKVNSLIKKGYLRKVQSPEDRREYHLEVTPRYLEDYNISSAYQEEVIARVVRRFSPQERAQLEMLLLTVRDELMPEAHLPSSAPPEDPRSEDALAGGAFSPSPLPKSRV